MEQLIMFLKLMTFFSADDFHFNLGFFIKLIRLKLTHRRLSKRNYIVSMLLLSLLTVVFRC